MLGKWTESLANPQLGGRAVTSNIRKLRGVAAAAAGVRLAIQITRVDHCVPRDGGLAAIARIRGVCSDMLSQLQVLTRASTGLSSAAELLQQHASLRFALASSALSWSHPSGGAPDGQPPAGAAQQHSYHSCTAAASETHPAAAAQHAGSTPCEQLQQQHHHHQLLRHQQHHHHSSLAAAPQFGRRFSSAAAAAQPDTGAAAGSTAGAGAPASAAALTQPTLLLGHSSPQLTEADIGGYYCLNTALIPEAGRPFHQAFYAPRPHSLQRKGGCRGLQLEQAASGAPRLMYRRVMHDLRAALQRVGETAAAAGGGRDSSSSPRRWLLQGPPGCGKSLLLLSCVEWARAAGWLVLYIPSAAALTSGGFFYQRPGNLGGGWDTIISAQHTLKSVADVHKQQLAELPITLPAAAALLKRAGGGAAGQQQQQQQGKQKAAANQAITANSSRGGSLLDLVMAGLGTDDDGVLAVDSCRLLVEELAGVAARRPVLLAVDDYSSLYGPTGYGRHEEVGVNQGNRVTRRHPLSVEDLNLASSMRLLARPDLQSAAVLAATSTARNLPAAARQQLPLGPDVATLDVPRYSFVESAHALYYYHEVGLLEAPPSGEEVAQVAGLTRGSGAELRQWCVGTTQLVYG